MGKGILGDSAPPQGGGGGRGIWHVRLLDDGEYCRMRFLTDHDGFFWERFHRMFRASEQGPRKFAGFKICVNSFLGQACEQCNSGDQPGTQILAWCYEMEHFHVAPPPNVKTEQVTIGTRTYSKETVNGPRVLRLSSAHLGTIKVKAERLGTLFGHEFEWVRTGARGIQRPAYSLEIASEVEMPAELKALMASLPSLEDVALNKAEGPGGDDSGGGDSGGAGGGGEKKEYAVREVPVEEDTEEAAAASDVPFPSDEGEGEGEGEGGDEQPEGNSEHPFSP